jgi:hypothetical protein
VTVAADNALILLFVNCPGYCVPLMLVSPAVVNYLVEHWGYIAAACGTVAAAAVFFKDSLTVIKLRHEIRDLQEKQTEKAQKESSVVRTATDEEIIRYASVALEEKIRRQRERAYMPRLPQERWAEAKRDDRSKPEIWQERKRVPLVGIFFILGTIGAVTWICILIYRYHYWIAVGRCALAVAIGYVVYLFFTRVVFRAFRKNGSVQSKLRRRYDELRRDDLIRLHRRIEQDPNSNG